MQSALNARYPMNTDFIPLLYGGNYVPTDNTSPLRYSIGEAEKVELAAEEPPR